MKLEDITVENLSDNLNFDASYLVRYEEERELQRIKLEEKEDLIKRITESSNEIVAGIQSKLDETQKKLQMV